MTRNQNQRKFLRGASLLSVALMGTMQTTKVLATTDSNDSNTNTPIKHVVIVVGENRTFDHLFATYKPKTGTVSNLLSKGIINADGTPGPNFSLAAQASASVTSTFSINPTTNKQTYTTLPLPKAGGYTTPLFPNTAAITAAANAYNAGNLPYVLSTDLSLLTTGGTGLTSGTPDTRIANLSYLKPGPFQLITNQQQSLYGAYSASPVHRFYQMWQELDCSASYATTSNPSGCKGDLFAWVENTVAAGSNGAAIPSAGFVSSEGSTALGFYNVQDGDMPYFKSLADNYTIADNYHQPVMGGTGANSVMLGTADPIWYSDGNGNPLVPPSNEIENPDPQSGTNNYYTQDGYSGGTFSNCSQKTTTGATSTQPGVPSVTAYLNSINVPIHCDNGHYYLLNNYDPGYYGDGSVDSPANSTWGVSNGGFVIPPSSVPTIAELLSNNHISWSYYGEGWTAYKANPTSAENIYCNICNPFLYSTKVMTGNDLNGNPLRNNLKDTSDFDNDIANGTLPAVSYVKPGGLLDGHPASSKYTLFEAFAKRIVQTVQSSSYANNTAILITTDEGGGYYDSGYVQPLDFFGDGTRISLIVVSPYSTGGRVVHTYYDHASVIKFIEANWNQNGTNNHLPTLSGRSRDNYANPIVASGRGASANPYIPTNGPAIGNLMNMFVFPSNQPAD